MKVICIDENDQGFKEEYPCVKKGRIYTVYDIVKLNKDKSIGGFICRAGEYYKLIEMGDGQSYYHDMFIKIEENQLDETTFERNYKTQTV